MAKSYQALNHFSSRLALANKLAGNESLEFKKQRIIDELKKAGVTWYGLLKLESRHLPSIINDDEHISGVIYGRSSEGSAMLVATNRRVIYLDRKPFFTTADQISYDTISGVKSNKAGPFYTVVLHTRNNDYKFRFVNSTCARNFINYIEEKRIAASMFNYSSGTYATGQQLKASVASAFSDEALEFVKSRNTAVLSTTGVDNSAHGATINYLIDQNNQIYITTAINTQKSRNMITNGRIALTVHDSVKLKTVQIEGVAEAVVEPRLKSQLLYHMTRPQVREGMLQNRLIANLEAGEYTVFRIVPTSARYIDFMKK